MKASEIRAAVMEVLEKVAPGVDADALDSRQPLRTQIDLDSMDWLNCIVGLSERLHVQIPERDYSSLQSLDRLLAYLEERLR